MKWLMMCLLLGVSMSIHAEAVHKCKSAQGKMQYQKTPCAESMQEISTWTPKNDALKLSGDNTKKEKARPIVLKKGQGGHYFINADVNSHSIMFLVDTGATTVSLPKSVAMGANMFCNEKVLMRTAAGNTSGCTAVITELRLGDFTFKNVTAAIVPKLKQPLLGMNVLNHFDIEQKDGEMRLLERESK